jgi:transposase
MERYVGMDVHSQSCTLAVIGPSGKRLKAQVVETNGKAIVDALKSIAGDKYICIEEGEQSDWLYEILSPCAKEVVVTTPQKREGPKDDLRDAYGLAEMVRIGAVKTKVYKAPAHFSRLRNAVRAYVMALQDVVRVKCRLKGVYRSRGLSTDREVYHPKKRVKWLAKLPASHRQLAEWIGQELDALVPIEKQAKAWMLEEAKPHAIIRKLATAPGMGSIRTPQLVAIVVSPHRFRTTRQFWSYCGLGIVTRSSADWVRTKDNRWVRAETRQTRGLNHNRHPLLKSIFKGAATTVIQKSPDHPLHKNYQRMLAAGIKPNLAKLTMARRIAAAMLAMWKHNEVYDTKRSEPKTSA